MITINFYVPGVGKTVIFPASLEEAQAETRKLVKYTNVTAIEVRIPKADMYDDVQYVDVHRYSKHRKVWTSDVIEVEKSS